jgi:N-acetylglucosamine-6-sulfatase
VSGRPNASHDAQRSAARRARAALCVVAAAALALVVHLGCAGSSSAGAPAPPNVLLIVTDDQPTGMVKRMHTLDRAPGFVQFGSYYDNNPLCCPTRSTLLTGLYSHHTGVETNLVAQRFDDSSTLATWLDDAGYETGLFGKYLNDYPWDRGHGFVPPGWDDWSAFTPDAAYYDYTLIGANGSRRHYGRAPGDYSTDVLADQADDFIADAASSQAPFFAYFAPYGPHSPRTPAPRDRHAFANAAVKLPKNFNRVAKGAPRWWAHQPRLDSDEERQATRDQWRTLQSVDDAIGRFIKTLKRSGAYENTVIVFLSDNGYSLGSHRNPQKDCAYEECIHLPLMIRWPGHTGPAKIGALTGSMDIAPTIAELAGVTPARPVDGQSLVPLLSGAASSLDRPILLRHVQYPKVAPSFWGLRTERWTYVTYDRSGERELYDDHTDPHQLRNLAGDQRYRDVVAELQSTLERLRSD